MNQPHELEPVARDGMHAVHSLDRFVFTVPSLDEAEHFYDAFGLECKRTSSSSLDLHTHGHPHRWGTLYLAPGRKKLQYLRFGCYAQDLEPIARRAQLLGVPVVSPHPLGDNDGVWLQHPDGFPVQLAVASKCSPDAKSVARLEPPVPLGVGASLGRSRIPKVLPRRLSHVVIFSPDVPRAARFYTDVLGLRISDRSGDDVVFMHGVHGSDHHLLGVARSDGHGLHHTSWDVANIDEIGRGMEQMYTAGYTQGWGVGRHVLGSNYFYYARDPWGSHCEYSFDIDFVPPEFVWPAADHPPEDSFYAWGPAVPPDFVKNFEAAAD